MNRHFLTAFCLFFASTTNALPAEGNSYRCQVIGFHQVSDRQDAAFQDQNMQKVFDVFDLGDRFKVVMNSRSFKSGVTEYADVKRGVLVTTASEASTSGQGTFAIESSPKSEPVSATIALQSSDFVNVWRLQCIRLK